MFDTYQYDIFRKQTLPAGDGDESTITLANYIGTEMTFADGMEYDIIILAGPVIVSTRAATTFIVMRTTDEAPSYAYWDFCIKYRKLKT